jgi:Fe-S oxidoreductase
MIPEHLLTTADYCRYCLMCRHTCPVGHVTHLESLTPHGWALLIASTRRGLAEWNPETVDVLYKCADCGNCHTHCVTEQPLPEAIAAARAEVVRLGMAPAVVAVVDRALREWGNPYVEELPRPLAGTGETALFVGDAARHLRPAALEAALRLLAAVGAEPVLIGDGLNNGYLPSSLGLPETAADLVRANLSELQASGANHLLVLTPGDYFVFHNLIEWRLEMKPQTQARLLEVTAVLAERLAAGELRLRPAAGVPPYAYVDPSHTNRVPGHAPAPRRLLDAVWPGARRELFWREHRTHPAGDVSLAFTQPELASTLTRARLQDAAAAGAQVVVTEDPAVLSHLERHAAEFGLQVRGLYELLADALEEEERTDRASLTDERL